MHDFVYILRRSYIAYFPLFLSDLHILSATCSTKRFEVTLLYHILKITMADSKTELDSVIDSNGRGYHAFKAGQYFLPNDLVSCIMSHGASGGVIIRFTL